MEGVDLARQTQAEVPHLVVLADEGRSLSEAVDLVHAGAAPGGKDTDAPTTIIVDRSGTVRWLFRPDSAISRLSPDEVLRALDQHLPKPGE